MSLDPLAEFDTARQKARQSYEYLEFEHLLRDMEFYLGSPPPREYVWTLLEIAREALSRAKMYRKAHLT